jgi:ArsR family transcriptional regulator
MQDVLAVAKALADESRLRALCALEHGELCVCQIIELLGLAPSTVSKHMSILRQAGLVRGRKDGRWMHYRLPGGNARGVVRDAIEWACGSLSKSTEVRRDGVRLKRILTMDRKELCSRACSR